MHNRIGVIVPVYKVEKYIAECIESILAQTYTNFRLILVDDGTPDNAGKICDEYAKKDSRITVIHQENAGVTRARARGVEEAKDCEFITFVDSDDIIASLFLEELHNAMDEYADIVINEHKIPSGRQHIDKYIEYLFTGEFGIQLAPWNRMFRRALFSTPIFDIPRSIVVGEDMLMNIRLAFSSSKEYVIIIDKPMLYTYRENETSITRTFKSSIEYEQMFQESLKQSMPKEKNEKYFLFTIKNRLKNFNRFYGNKYRVKGMKSTIFYEELRRDIEKFRYRLPTLDRILLYYENSFVRFMAIKAKCFQRKFLNK